MRTYYYKLYKEFSLISFENSQLFETITINFITNILFARNLYIKKTNNTILILIDKLIKHAIYIIIIKKFNTRNFVESL